MTLRTKSVFGSKVQINVLCKFLGHDWQYDDGDEDARPYYYCKRSGCKIKDYGLYLSPQKLKEHYAKK